MPFYSATGKNMISAGAHVLTILKKIRHAQTDPLLNPDGNSAALKPGHTWIFVATPYSSISDEGNGVWKLMYYALKALNKHKAQSLEVTKKKLVFLCLGVFVVNLLDKSWSSHAHVCSFPEKAISTKCQSRASCGNEKVYARPVRISGNQIAAKRGADERLHQRTWTSPLDKLDEVSRDLWSLPQREFQYVATGLISRLENQLKPKFITTIEYLLVTKSWWDTVDSIAGDIVGTHFKRFPDVREKYLKKWRKSDNFWLRRTTLLFQLGYKKETDFGLMCEIIKDNLGSDEFFINKAIGWALRQYAHTNPAL